jgi:hypothetical protein
MRGILKFLRATVIGGVFLLAPLVVLGVVLSKAFDVVAKAVRPLSNRIPDSLGLGAANEDIIAALSLVLLCFLAGLLARSGMATKLVEILESAVLSRIPGYDYIRLEGASALGLAEAKELPVVLASVGDCWQIGIKTETIGWRRCAAAVLGRIGWRGLSEAGRVGVSPDFEHIGGHSLERFRPPATDEIQI